MKKKLVNRNDHYEGLIAYVNNVSTCFEKSVLIKKDFLNKGIRMLFDLIESLGLSHLNFEIAPSANDFLCSRMPAGEESQHCEICAEDDEYGYVFAMIVRNILTASILSEGRGDVIKSGDYACMTGFFRNKGDCIEQFIGSEWKAMKRGIE